MPTRARKDVKILCSDDDFEILEILKSHFRSRGFDVEEANNGEEALEQAFTFRPDAMVLDVMMPRLNGWEVARHLRERDDFDKTGIVMLTAIGPNLNALTSPLYGADAHVDKPFELEDVEAAVERVLAERAGITLSDDDD